MDCNRELKSSCPTWDACDEHAFAVTGRSGRRGAPSLPAGAHVRRPKRIPPGGRDAAPPASGLYFNRALVLHDIG